MKEQKLLTSIFAKYAGREVDANDRNDSTLKELRDELDQAGFKLRVWTPGSMGSMDHRMDRVNIHLGNGKCKIGNSFKVG